MAHFNLENELNHAIRMDLPGASDKRRQKKLGELRNRSVTNISNDCSMMSEKTPMKSLSQNKTPVVKTPKSNGNWKTHTWIFLFFFFFFFFFFCWFWKYCKMSHISSMFFLKSSTFLLPFIKYSITYPLFLVYKHRTLGLLFLSPIFVNKTYKIVLILLLLYFLICLLADIFRKF